MNYYHDSITQKSWEELINLSLLSTLFVVDNSFVIFLTLPPFYHKIDGKWRCFLYETTEKPPDFMGKLRCFA